MVLSWVAGNDMFLCVWLYETILVDGSATRQPFDFSTCDSAESSLVSRLGKKFVIPHEFHATDMNGLIMQIPCTIPPGKYSIDIKVVQDGYHLRSFEGGVVGIVAENAHAYTTFERISGAHHADYEVELGLIPLAEERPLNMYEEWKLQPGHEDMTFDDFMNDYAQQQVEVAIGDALDSKVDKVQGKGLSTNDFTDILKEKLDDMPNLKEVDSRELDGMISDSDEGFYVADGPGGPLLVEVYKDGATVYQWAVEPHSGHILVRTYNTHATSPTWSEFTDAYADKQDTISDLSTIRSGAAAGATAVQPAALTPIQSAISVIEDLIPSAASAQNQLADKNYVDTHSSDIDVDDALSTSSENPVQNKVVTAALNGTVTNKGSNGNVRVGVGNYSNIDITSSSIGMETENGAILIGNDITLNTSGVVKYNGSRVATATDLQGKQDVIQDLSTIRSGASAGATAYQKPQAGIPNTDLASAVQTSLGKADTAVQPAAMNTALASKQDTISDLSTIRSGAAAGATAVQPATMNTALAAKQDTLTFDNAPTANSNNPVKSSGVKTAIDSKQDTISTVNVTVDNNTGTPSGSASVSGGTLSLSFQNLKGATGAQGPQGIQGVQGPQGPKGDTGVTGDASSLAIIHGIDKTSSYAITDVCGADAAQALLNEIEGGFYY